MKNKLSYFLSKRLTSLWQDIYFKNNEECLILGSGSSIKSINLDAFEGIPIITCNLNMYLDSLNILNFILVNIPEPYFFASNSRLFYKTFGLIKKNIKEDEIIELMQDWCREIKRLKDINFLMHLTSITQFYRNRNVYYFLKGCYDGANNRFVPHNFLDSNNFGGSFYSCLTSAYLAGFKKCYIFGFDSFTLTECSNTRFYEKDKPNKKNNLNNTQKAFYNYLNKKMNLQVLTLPGQQSLLNSRQIKSIFKKINYQKEIEGINLFSEKKRKLITDFNNICIKNKNLSSKLFYA